MYGPVSSVPVPRSLQKPAAGAGGLDTSHLDAVPGLRAGRILGPAWTGNATASGLSPMCRPAVRRLAAADLGLLARLHAAAPPAEVAESGTDEDLPSVGTLP